jgi:hypothetical protein
MTIIEDKTKNEVFKTAGQHYYAEFSNSAGNRYYLVFDEKAVLTDSIIRNGPRDIHALKQIEKKYGPLVKLSAIPALSNLPILDVILAEQKEASDKWSAAWSKMTPDIVNKLVKQIEEANPKPAPTSDKPARFVINRVLSGVKVVEGVRWTNGSITTVTNGLHRSYADWTEFYDQVMKPELWKFNFIWLDDENKSKAAADKMLSVAKEAAALSKKASELVDTIAVGK